jgi:hypothetical protein
MCFRSEHFAALYGVFRAAGIQKQDVAVSDLEREIE